MTITTQSRFQNTAMASLHFLVIVQRDSMWRSRDGSSNKANYKQNKFDLTIYKFNTSFFLLAFSVSFTLLYLTLSCSILLYLTLSCSILLYLTLSCSILLYLALPHSILLYLALPHSILLYLALPHSILLYLTLPHSILLYLALFVLAFLSLLSFHVIIQLVPIPHTSPRQPSVSMTL